MSSDDTNKPGGPRSEPFIPGARPVRGFGQGGLEPLDLGMDAIQPLDEISDLQPLDDDGPRPAFVVLVDGEPPRFFELTEEDDELSLGRGGDADVPIPHKTVSRQHARLAVEPGEGVILEDMESDNGTSVNGERIERACLRAGDRIQLGTLDIVYVGDVLGERTYKGQPVTELAEFPRTAVSSRHEATFAMSVGLMQRMKAVRDLLSKAKLVPEGEEGWKLGSGMKRFGRKHPDVAVRGWFVSADLAELVWTGRKHRLRRTGRWGKVLVNGKAVEMADLETGDKLRIGNSRFSYVVG